MVITLVIMAALLILGGGQKFVNHVDNNAWYSNNSENKKRD